MNSRFTVNAATVGLFLCSLAGRFGFARLDLEWPLPVPERTVAVALLLLIFGGVLARESGSSAMTMTRRQTISILTLVSLMIATGLWRGSLPVPSQQPDLVWDMSTLGAMCALLGLYLRANARQTLRVWLWCTLWAGVVFAVAGITAGGDRAAAFGGGPNVFGRVTALAVLAALALVYGFAASRAALLCVPVLVAATVLSGSRGAMLSLGIGLAVIAIPFVRRIRGRDLIALVLVGAVGVAAWSRLGAVVASVFEYRVLELTIYQSHDSGRSPLYRAAIELFVERPFAGWGLGGFEAQYGIRHSEIYPHNIFLQFAAEGGLIALALLALILTRMLFRTNKTFLGRAMLAMALLSLVSAQTSGDYFDSRNVFFSALFCAALFDTFRDTKTNPETGSAATGVSAKRSQMRGSVANDLSRSP